jgi:hypothetical protein
MRGKPSSDMTTLKLLERIKITIVMLQRICQVWNSEGGQRILQPRQAIGRRKRGQAIGSARGNVTNVTNVTDGFERTELRQIRIS